MKKITKEGKYSVDSLYKQIEDYAKKNDLIKIHIVQGVIEMI